MAIRTLKDSLLPMMDVVRSIPGRLGFRTTRIWLRVSTWTGDRDGVGTKTVTDTPLYVGALNGRRGYNPRVETISDREVIASGGKYKARDIRIGPLSPHFVDMIRGTYRLAGGTTYAAINPPTSASATEVHFVVDEPSGCYLYERVEEEIVRPLHYTIVLRSLGIDVPTPTAV